MRDSPALKSTHTTQRCITYYSLCIALFVYDYLHLLSYYPSSTWTNAMQLFIYIKSVYCVRHNLYPMLSIVHYNVIINCNGTNLIWKSTAINFVLLPSFILICICLFYMCTGQLLHLASCIPTKFKSQARVMIMQSSTVHIDWQWPYMLMPLRLIKTNLDLQLPMCNVRTLFASFVEKIIPNKICFHTLCTYWNRWGYIPTILNFHYTMTPFKRRINTLNIHSCGYC